MSNWAQHLKEVLIGCVVAATLLAVIVIGAHLIQSFHDSDAQVEIEKQHTEQQRLDSCNHIEDQAVRVLCLNGAPNP